MLDSLLPPQLDKTGSADRFANVYSDHVMGDRRTDGLSVVERASI